MVQLTLFTKEIEENRIKLLILLPLLAVIALAIPSLYEPYRDCIRNAPLWRFHMDEAVLGIIAVDYTSFVWSQWPVKYLLWLSAAAAVLFGAGVLGGEIGRGTALFLASKPVTRREIYTTKAAAGLAMLALCVFIPTLVLVLVSSIKGFFLDHGTFLTAALITFAGAAVIYLGTAVLSVLIPVPFRAGAAAALFWLVASVPGCFDATAVFSIYYHMSGVPYWLLGGNPIVPLGFFLVLGGLFYELGVWLWSRHDI